MHDLRSRGTLLLAALLLLLAVCAHGLIARDTALELARLATERERLATAREHEAQLRVQLVGHALDPARGVEDRQRVLRFLHAISTDSVFRQWAEAELASLQPEVDALHEARESDTASLRRAAAAPAAPTAE